MASRGFIKFSIKEYGFKEAGSLIAKLRLRLDDTGPMLREIGEIQVANTLRRFDTQTDPKGRVWKHNTRTTQMLKKYGMGKRRGVAIKGPNHRLEWTGELRASIHYRVGGNTVYVIADTPYAQVQQQGGVGPDNAFGKPIPPRPYLGTNDKTNAQVLSVLQRYLLGSAGLPAWPVGFPKR